MDPRRAALRIVQRAELGERGRRLLDARRGAPRPPLDAEAGVAAQLEAMRARLDHLESQIESLQDQVYRDATRQDERYHELHEKTDAPQVARALSDHARRHGL
jgi:hypothetical protein